MVFCPGIYRGPDMERFTVSLDGDLLAEFDRYIEGKGYENRSEAVRDILRERLRAEQLAPKAAVGDCVACLSYVYNHHERELPKRVMDAQHASHDLVRSTMHVHLDHDYCMEIAVLQGPTQAVHRFADALMAETGVMHGKLSAIPVDMHVAGGQGHKHRGHALHSHARPKV